jgi:hypothetical protein
MNIAAGVCPLPLFFLCIIDRFGFDGADDLAAMLFLQAQPVEANP